MADQITLPHPHIDMRGGFVRIVDEEATWFNAFLRGLKDNKRFLFDFDGLKHRCHRAEATLAGIGLPDHYWDGITFLAYSKGPEWKSDYRSFVGIGVKVQRRNDEWILLNGYKAVLSVEENGDPHFDQLTAEQWAQVPDPDDDPNPYRRRTEIKFTKRK